MDVEIVISGICSLINLDTQDETIIGPSVVLLKADTHLASVIHDQNKPCDCVHIPFLAYDVRDVSVDDTSQFKPVVGAPSFRYIPLPDVELRIDGDTIGVPILDATYANVVSRDEHWPEAKDKWNHDVVPLAGNRPKKSAVSGFLKLGGGTIKGGRLCPFKWKFTKLDGKTFSRHFAEEVLYDFEEPEREQITIRFFELETGKDLNSALVFRRLYGEGKLMLFLGNHTETGIKVAVRRRRANNTAGQSDHFAFFNRVVDVGAAPAPPLPTGIQPPEPASTGGGGGADGGICGPKNG
ncbi:MAG: hypothetical protein QOJ98_1484 [Acidobacteriota bacterium]|jgi:hypothetical protein|nr:hypothetical protein [Acidobacteriota bacterium]